MNKINRVAIQFQIRPRRNLRRYVLGDLTNINQSADRLFHFDRGLRIGILHPFNAGTNETNG